MRLHVRTIDALDGLWSLAGEWNELLERADDQVPFLLPEWLAMWWQAFRQDHGFVRDTLRVKTVRTESGKLVGLVPFMLTERPRVGPLRARGLSLLGADPYITEHRAPIVDPAHEADVARAIAANLRAENDWDWITWDGLTRDSEFALGIERTMGVAWSDGETANLVRLAPTWERFKKGLKRNIKESLRHCANSLKRDGVTTHLQVAETPEEVGRALEVFFRLHALRAAQARAPHPDRFAGAGPKQFLLRVCARLAERNVARVFTLYAGRAPVAARVGFVLPACLYLYYSGCDPAWNKYGVMTTTVAEAIKYAIGLGLPAVHLSMGADVSKARWGPDARVFHRAHSVRSGWKSHTALKLYSWGRDNVSRAGAIGRVLPVRRFDQRPPMSPAPDQIGRALPLGRSALLRR